MISIFIIQIFAMIIIVEKCETNVQSTDWKETEELIELHSYIVAILNFNKEYICTGSIISPLTVITAGHCLKKEPAFLVTGLCIIRNEIPKHNLIKIKSADTHHDYKFYNDRSEMHSNLGILTVSKPVLTYLAQSARMNNNFASELKKKILTVVGFGRTLQNITIIQKQKYRGIYCVQPKLFYCVCGKEMSQQEDMIDFAEGAPVILDRYIVGIVAATRSNYKPEVRLRSPDEVNNIFTVLGPYEAWLHKSTSFFRRTSVRSGCTSFESISWMFISIFVFHFLSILINCMPILY